jgi:hypothetical protein
MKIEEVMERMIDYLYEAICEMLILTEQERFEEAAYLRDDIDRKIIKVKNYIIKRDLTKLSNEQLYDNLMDIKYSFIKELSEKLEIPREHHIFNI